MKKFCRGKSTPQAIEGILKEVVENLTASKTTGVMRVYALWPGVVGMKFAKHTKPATLHKGRLIVNVSESAWLYQINLQKEQILQGLQKKLGVDEVQTIQFRIGVIK